MTRTVLGIDLGTSSVKVVLADLFGAILARQGADYPVDRPFPGWAETDPEAWWRAIVSATRAVVAAAPEPPSAVGLSGQMHGVVLTGADGSPVRPAVLWADSRAGLSGYRSLAPEVGRRLANPLSPGMAGPELAWLHEHEPAAVAAAAHALQPKDWVRARLTGRFQGEPSDASATLLYDVLARAWDDDVVAALGIDRSLLPELLPSAGAEAGRLVTTDLGLPLGIPVAAGAADTAAAALGSALTEPGTVQLTIGTGVQIVTPVSAPTPGTLPDQPVTHLYRSATDAGWYAMAAGLTGGQTLDWVRRILGADWAELYGAAARGPHPGDPVFLPHLIGERTPYLDTGMRGAWAGLDARHDRAALLHSALEGVAFAVAEGFDALKVAPGAEVRLAGGGTTDPGWRQLLADVLGTPLHPVEVPDASARGAALLAAGLLEPVQPVEPGGTPGRGEPVVPRAFPGDRRELWTATLNAVREVTF